MKYHPSIIYFLSIILLYSCKGGGSTNEIANESGYTQISNDSLLTLIQQKSFQYFWEGAEPISGMAHEYIFIDNQETNQTDVISTGGTGFGIMAIIIGVERGFISRDEGLNRILQIVDFLQKAKRYHGAWPRLMNGENGNTIPYSNLDNGADLVETSYLIQGLLIAKQYFNNTTVREKLLVSAITKLWKEVEWSWFTKSEDVLYRHWSPDYGWQMNEPIWGWNGQLITYVLAASSPTFTINPQVYHKGWARNGEIKTESKVFGYPVFLNHFQSAEYGGPLCWSQKAFTCLDPRKLKDIYADYWDVNLNHTLINRQWCIENKNDFKGYSNKCWGISSSFSPRGFTLQNPGPQTDLGIITPSAAIGSMPYSAENSSETLNFFFYTLGDKILGKYGFYDAFSIHYNWYPKIYSAHNQGITITMVENYRSGLLWKLFMSVPEVQDGLIKLGFTY